VKNFRTIVFSTIAVCAISANLLAQDTIPQNDSTNSAPGKLVWSVGVSGVVIDDDGEPFNNLFNVGDSWNFLPFPTRLNVDVAFNQHWSVEAALSYSQYKSGKVVNDLAITEDQMFVAFDANAKYHFIAEPKIFDPYTVSGLGFTYRSGLQEQTPTVNLGLGVNIWFVKCFGINLQTSGKIKLNTKSSNYLMHSAGIVYRFGGCK
jgi:hypothetical protein